MKCRFIISSAIFVAMFVKNFDNIEIECPDGLISLPSGPKYAPTDCAIQVKSNPECSIRFFYAVVDGTCKCEKVRHTCKRIHSSTMAQYRLIESNLF